MRARCWKTEIRTALFAVLLLSGCVAPPKPTGFTPAHDALGKGMFVDQAWVAVSALQTGRYGEIALGSVDTSAVSDQKGISASEAAASLRSALVGSDPGGVILKLPGEPRSARLEVAITELNPGSAFGRVMAGELGAGHAWVQVEAKLLDPDSGDVVAVFVERSRDSGAIGLRDTFGSVGPELVHEMLARAAKDIRSELGAQLPAAP